jgi:hypothetical protein
MPTMMRRAVASFRRRRRQALNARLKAQEGAGGALADIAGRHDTTKGRRRAAKGRWPSLAEVYDAHLSGLRETATTVLEIGVEYGGSVQMWAEYFPAARIWGVDIDRGTAKLATDRISIRIGDQSDRSFLESLIAETGPLDLVVDDGSHRFEDQRETLLFLWPHLRPGGVYIVEDIHTSYRATYGGDRLKPGTFVEFLKGVLDDIHVKEHHGPVSLPDVESVHVAFQTAILRKRPSA